ncbi:LysR family transcriptional regulator [Labedaea rhizosphaerae]|uniref:DNA-binding transcriptional LysR family regulator n=1 Tax=Labedaea rhizosphaerae TaxID=598644 RepID=A0A4R6SIK8_LABRH|nr:LysR substrate-binding domain-containing protein [Labedaea rhizosphaerae]TDQ01477.1 DNA-binding transcriptional LysR family regulator [Labedaea rhizosphaerae]
MLDLHRLALLREFAERGSIAATAVATGYSASAVSQHLSALEREAGTTLLDRTARSATLTEAGVLLAEHAVTVLAAVEAAESDVAALTGEVTGRVVVSVFPTAATAFAPVLAGLRTTYPRLEIALRQHGPREALPRLRNREADLAVVDDWGTRKPPLDPDLHRVPLLRDPLYLAGDRASHTWLCAPPDQPSRVATDRVLAREGIEPVLRWEFEGLATIAELVANGTGAAVLPGLALLTADPPRIRVRGARRIDALVRTASRTRPAVAVTLEALRHRAKELSTPGKTPTP